MRIVKRKHTHTQKYITNRHAQIVRTSLTDHSLVKCSMTSKACASTPPHIALKSLSFTVTKMFSYQTNTGLVTVQNGFYFEYK